MSNAKRISKKIKKIEIKKISTFRVSLIKAAEKSLILANALHYLHNQSAVLAGIITEKDLPKIGQEIKI